MAILASDHARSFKSVDRRQAILRRFEVLKHLSEEDLDEMAQHFFWVSVRAGKQILLANEVSSDVHFIIAGKVKLLLYSATEGKPVLLATMGASAMFGELAAIDGLPRLATVEAVEDCEFACLPREQFQRFLGLYPAFSSGVIRHLAAHVRSLTDRVYEFSTLRVQGRVYAELLRLAKLAGEREGKALLAPAPLLADMAAQVSTHREAVSRVISRLQDRGILRREGSSIHILDADGLRRLLEGMKGE